MSANSIQSAIVDKEKELQVLRKQHFDLVQKENQDQLKAVRVQCTEKDVVIANLRKANESSAAREKLRIGPLEASAATVALIMLFEYYTSRDSEAAQK